MLASDPCRYKTPPNPLPPAKVPDLMAVNPFIWLILELIQVYTWIVVAAVIVSWLVVFGVINTYNRLARQVVQFLDAITDPVFRQVQGDPAHRRP